MVTISFFKCGFCYTYIIVLAVGLFITCDGDFAYNIFISIYIEIDKQIDIQIDRQIDRQIWIYIDIDINIIEGFFFEVAIESWPEWDLTIPLRGSNQLSYQAMSSTRTQNQFCATTPISSFVQCQRVLLKILLNDLNQYYLTKQYSSSFTLALY